MNFFPAFGIALAAGVVAFAGGMAVGRWLDRRNGRKP